MRGALSLLFNVLGSRMSSGALAARGVGPDDAEAFLDPKLRLLPDPPPDMDKAVARILRAING